MPRPTRAYGSTDMGDTVAAIDIAPPRRVRSRALRRFMRHRLAMLGVVVIVLLVFGTAVGPHLVAFDDLHIDIRNRFQPPFAGPHLLGSDPLGRDQFARLLMAGRV